MEKNEKIDNNKKSKTKAIKKTSTSKLKKDNKLSKEEVKNVKKQLKSAKLEVDTTYKPVSFTLIEVIVVILITGIVVSICSGLIVFNNYDKIISNSSSEKDKISEFLESYNHILESYVEDVDGDKLIDAAINGMYSYLGDSYSGYIDKETTESLQEQLEGKYKGVGIEITSDSENIIITGVFEGSPAEKAGLIVGDIITKVDGVSYIGKSASDVSNAIKKSSKKSFELTYIRDEKEYNVVVNKEEVYIDSVNSDVISGVGYIQIETFSATTMEQVKKKIDAFNDDIKNIIIDVRNNSGGYLSSAYETADLFIEKNKIIYKLKDKDGNITNYLDRNKVYRSFDNIVVLINEASASASEILAAALQESADAKLVGKQSFGKGTVQETEVLSSGAMVKHTSSYWLTPSGKSINNIGLSPDVVVKLDNNIDNNNQNIDNNNQNIDNQLDKAIEILK